MAQFNCRVCGNTFNHLTNLSRHQRVHENRKLFQCNECGRGMNSQSEVKAHKCPHSDIEREKFRCHVCGEGGVLGHRVEHMNLHFQFQYFQCTICNHTTNQSTVMKDHLRTHKTRQEKGIYQCSAKKCGATFTRNDSLRRHMKKLHQLN